MRDVGKRVFDDKSKLVISATLRNNADDAQSRNSAASMLSAGFVHDPANALTPGAPAPAPAPDFDAQLAAALASVPPPPGPPAPA